MRKHLAQYMNEIVSITVMLLMTIALIAGQAAPVSVGADAGPDRPSYGTVRVAGDE